MVAEEDDPFSSLLQHLMTCKCVEQFSKLLCLRVWRLEDSRLLQTCNAKTSEAPQWLLLAIRQTFERVSEREIFRAVLTTRGIRRSPIHCTLQQARECGSLVAAVASSN